MKTYNRTPAIPFVIGIIFSLIAIGLVTKANQQENQPLIALACLVVALLAFAGALFIRRQPPALILSPEGVMVRERIAGASQFYTWQEIEEVSYVIEMKYTYNSYFPKRELWFKGPKQRHLFTVQLNQLEAVDFNEIYQYSCHFTSHIRWIFPE